MKNARQRESQRQKESFLPRGTLSEHRWEDEDCAFHERNGLEGARKWVREWRRKDVVEVLDVRRVVLVIPFVKIVALCTEDQVVGQTQNVPVVEDLSLFFQAG